MGTLPAVASGEGGAGLSEAGDNAALFPSSQRTKSGGLLPKNALDIGDIKVISQQYLP